MNKVILIGNLGKDPESKTLENGTQLSTFSLATSESYKDKNGEKVINTEWHNVVCYGKIAETCNKYLHKGDKILVDGKIKYKTYEKDNEKKYFTEVQMFSMEFLNTKPEATNETPKVEAPKVEENDTLPF